MITTCAWGYKLLTLPVNITGHLKKNPKDTSAYVEGLLVFVKGNSKVLAKTFTDKKGDFELTFTPNKEKSFDFYCNGVAIDTLLIGSVKTFESDTPEMTFYVPAQAKKNALGQVLCPKCKKTDKVYKIVYGDGQPVRMEVSETGDTTYSSIINGRYYTGTCLVGVAKYFCDRDKAKF
ncbi:MAG: hypothetical protein EPN92_12940 [Chitinophagaceae bacterium]|nr:MAG: hypothetical protein EPN92_12940 [Chitinophagaceae bacterium]